MIEMTLAKTLFLICFARGFATAAILTLLALGGMFALRLWTLRDDLKELKTLLAQATAEETED